MNFYKGFTLVELLIVIGIIGILGSIFITMINPAEQQRKARTARLQQEISKIAESAEAYAATFGTYRAVDANGNDTGSNLTGGGCWDAWRDADGNQSFVRGSIPDTPLGAPYEIECESARVRIRGSANSATDWWHYSTGDGVVHQTDWHW